MKKNERCERPALQMDLGKRVTDFTLATSYIRLIGNNESPVYTGTQDLKPSCRRTNWLGMGPPWTRVRKKGLTISRLKHGDYRIDVSNGNKYIATYDATSYIKMEEAYAYDIPRLFNPTIHTLAAAWVPSLTYVALAVHRGPLSGPLCDRTVPGRALFFSL